MELFKSRDLRKKKWSLDLALELRNLEAAALIIKALQDQSWALREYAIAKAVQMGSMMVPPLCRLLKSGVWYSRAAAIQALDGIGDSRAIPHLWPMIADINQTVARTAGATMEHLLAQCPAEQLRELGRNLGEKDRKRLATMFPDRFSDQDFSEGVVDVPDDDVRDDPQILQQIRQAMKSCSKVHLESEDEEA